VGEFEVDADLVRGVLRIPVGSQFHSGAGTSPALLVLEKSDSTLAIVDPASLQVVARVPAGGSARNRGIRGWQAGLHLELWR